MLTLPGPRFIAPMIKVPVSFMVMAPLFPSVRDALLLVELSSVVKSMPSVSATTQGVVQEAMFLRGSLIEA
jgi:hypothetical protein